MLRCFVSVVNVVAVYKKWLPGCSWLRLAVEMQDTLRCVFKMSSQDLWWHGGVCCRVCCRPTRLCLLCLSNIIIASIIKYFLDCRGQLCWKLSSVAKAQWGEWVFTFPCQTCSTVWMIDLQTPDLCDGLLHSAVQGCNVICFEFQVSFVRLNIKIKGDYFFPGTK